MQAKRSTRPAKVAKVRKSPTPRPSERLADKAFPIAEKRLPRKREGSAAAAAPPDPAHLAQERQVHQVELELQNEELQRTRADLEESLARYTDLYESAPVGYLTLGRDGDIRQVNLTGARLLGNERARLVGRRLGLLLAAQSRPVFHAFLASVFASGTSQTCEVMSRPQEGASLTFELTGTTRDAADECRVVAKDVAERVRSEAALRSANERLRRFVDANIVGVIIANAAGAILETNDYYLQLVGYTREDLQQGRVDWRAMTPPEWLLADERAIEELRTRGTCTPYEKEYVRSDGTRVPVLLVDALLPGPDKLIVAFALDLTERKRADEALRESERRYGSMLTNIDLAAVILDRSARVTFCNDSLLRLTGWRREDVLGCDWFERFIPPPRDEVRRTFAAILDDKPEAWRHENEILGRSGERRLVRWSNAVLRSPSGEVIGTAGIGEDVTERKRTEEKIRSQLEELQRWHDVMLDREDRVQELKREVNELCRHAGEPARYPSQGGQPASDADIKPGS